MLKESLTPAEIVKRIQAECDALKKNADSALKGFVEDADAAHELLGQMSAELDAVDAEIAMLDSDVPPKGAEQYAKMLDEEEA